MGEKSKKENNALTFKRILIIQEIDTASVKISQSKQL